MINSARFMKPRSTRFPPGKFRVNSLVGLAGCFLTFQSMISLKMLTPNQRPSSSVRSESFEAQVEAASENQNSIRQCSLITFKVSIRTENRMKRVA